MALCNPTNLVGAGWPDKERLMLKIELGHESQMLPLGANPPSGVHTHRWTVFVRGLNDTPLDTQLVQKVVFQLHEDFPHPKRCVSSPPFEVTETGYAGFIIPLYIYFVNCRREYYLEYDMNLRYEPHFKTKEIKTLEFKDPKPELRAKLLKAGAEIFAGKSGKYVNNISSETENFASVFGEPIQVSTSHPSQNNQCRKLPNKVIKAPSKPAPTKSFPDAAFKLSAENSVNKTVAPGGKNLSNCSKDKNATKNDVACIEKHSLESIHPSDSMETKKSVMKISTQQEVHHTAIFTTNHSPHHFEKTEDKKKREKHKHRNKKEIPEVMRKKFQGAAQCSSTSKLEEDCCDTGWCDKQKNLAGPLRHLSPLFSTASPSYSTPPSPCTHPPQLLAGGFSASSFLPINSPIPRVKSPKRKRKKAGKEKLDKSYNFLMSPNVSFDRSTDHKRPKHRSDSGLDSDYSGRAINAQSPIDAITAPSTFHQDEKKFAVRDEATSIDQLTLISIDSLDFLTKKVSHKASGQAFEKTGQLTELPLITSDCSMKSSSVTAGVPMPQSVVASTHSSPERNAEARSDVTLRRMLALQRRIMSLEDSAVAQRIVDFLANGRQTFTCTNENLEFDLFSLGDEVIDRLLNILCDSAA